MGSLPSRRERALAVVVAVMELVGGLMGLWHLATNAPLPPSTSLIPIRVAVLVLFALLYATAVVAGLLLLLGRHLGRTASALVQALQLPSLSAFGATYTFVVGAGVLIELRWPGPETYLSAVVGSRYALFVGSKGVPPVLGVNALALTLLVLLIPLQTSRAHSRAEVTA